MTAVHTSFVIERSFAAPGYCPFEGSRLVAHDARLRSGMTARVDIEVASIPRIVIVPARAVFEKDGTPVVYVRSGDTFTPVEVKITHRTETHTAIEGIDAGTEVSLVNPDRERTSLLREWSSSRVDSMVLAASTTLRSPNSLRRCASTRSTAAPHHRRKMTLNRRCSAPPWTRVALSGVSSAGTAGDKSRSPLNRAGMKPISAAALSSAPSIAVSSQTIAVTAAITNVAVRL